MNFIGTHIILQNDCLPDDTGIILNNTSDGRLVFVLPYQGYMLVGTTDDMQDIVDNPKTEEQDIEFLKNEMKRIFGEDFDFEKHLKSQFAGLRPLCLDTPVSQSEYEEKIKSISSKDLCRSHVVEVSPSGLISLLGGKWTSYRIMGEETVDKAIKTHKLNNFKNEKSQAFGLKLVGGYSKIELKENMVLSPENIATKYKNQLFYLSDIPIDVAERLIENYGPICKYYSSNKFSYF